MSNSKSHSKTLHAGQYLNLQERDGWEFISRVHGVVMIVAITDQNELLLVEQYRQPLQKRVIELPAGLVGDHGEDEPPVTAAHRELLEETGYDAADIEPLLIAAASPGMANETIAIYRARQLTKVDDGGGDESEDIVVHRVALNNLAVWLSEKNQAGLMIDARVYAAPTLLSLEPKEIPGW